MIHPVLSVYLKIHTRRELFRLGYRRSEVNKMMDAATDETLEQAAHDANVVDKMGAIGDGTILQKILDFLKSPEGQALIKALISILLMVLTGL